MPDNRDAESALAAHVALMEDRMSDLEAVLRQALSWYNEDEENLPPRWVLNARQLIKEQTLDDAPEDQQSD